MGNFSNIDFDKFVEDELTVHGFKIITITEDLMAKRLEDFMTFVNGIRNEYKDQYGWNEETKEYFLAGMVKKWDYSICIVDKNDKLLLVNFSSVYPGNILHNHCTYVSKIARNKDLAKLYMIKIAQKALNNGIKVYDGYWPINNNGSIILFLKMGWEIKSLRKGKELYLAADLINARDKAYTLYLKEKTEKKIIAKARHERSLI